MIMLTKAIEKKLPRIYSQEDIRDPIVQVKYFTPWSRWTWYGIEYDPVTREFFGYVKSGIDPDYDELGYFSLEELETIRGPFGLKVERDMHFTPCPLSEIKKGVRY